MHFLHNLYFSPQLIFLCRPSPTDDFFYQTRVEKLSVGGLLVGGFWLGIRVKKTMVREIGWGVGVGNGW